MKRVGKVAACVLLAVASLSLSGCGGGGGGSNENPAGSGSDGAQVWFREATAQAGLSTALHPGYALSWGDLNGDGWMDMWIVNHMYEPTIYLNNRDGTFADVTNKVWNDALADFHGGSWADFDNDGDQDFALLAGGERGTECGDKPFYVNDQGVLKNQADLRNLNDRCGRGRTPLWLDWNNDGLLDLYLVNGRRPADLLSPSRMMLQQPDGTFVEAPELQTQAASFSAQMLYVGGAMHLLTNSGAPYPASFYKVGDPSPLPFRLPGFADGELPLNVTDVVAGDFDGDLQDDLFIVRTAPGGKTYRLRSDGKTLDVLVKDIGTERGVMVSAPNVTRVTFRFWVVNWKAGEIRLGQSAVAASVTRVAGDEGGEELFWTELSVDAGDPNLQGFPPADQRTQRGVYIGRDADGRWRVHANGLPSETLQYDMKVDQGPISDIQSEGFEFRTDIAQRPNLLAYFNGDFIDRARNWRINKAFSCNSAVAGDFDNDGDLDVFLACTGPATHLPNILLENKGGYFEEVADAGGAAVRWSEEPGGVAAAADYDNDGYLDILLAEGCEVCGPPLRFGHRVLLRNVRSGSHWVQFDLVGCQSNRDGIGARLVIEAGGKQQMRVANGGMHTAAQGQKRIHFGLARSERVDRLRVEWPSGKVTSIDGLAADKIHTIREDAASCPSR
jgi:hypothetical protein